MSSTKAIYAGCRALGLDEDTRRDLYERVTAKRRLREMAPREKAAVVEELRRLGFRVGPGGGARRKLDGPYAAKLQALWISAWNLGLARSREDAALIAFVKRQTGLDHTRFVREQADAMRVVEGLKAWLARDGGVDWTLTAWDDDWWRNPMARVVDAQARRLGMAGVREVVLQPDCMGRADWIAAMNDLGLRIRAMRP